MKRILTLLAFTLLFLPASTASAAELEVVLKDAAVVYSPQVLLSDIAKVTSADSKLQQKAASLEIRQIDSPGTPPVRITAMSVRTRLVLDGWSILSFNIAGSPAVSVTCEEPSLISDADITVEFHRTMCSLLGTDEKDLAVHLQNAFVQSLPADVRNRHGLTVKVVPPARPNLGGVTTQVQIWNGKEMILSRLAVFEVRRRYRVAIARVSMTTNDPLDESSVQIERRFFSEEKEELDPSQLSGRTVKGTVKAGEVLQTKHLQATASGKAPVIRRGDLVNVHVFAGRLQTSFRNAEALDDAAIGEMIEVKNRDTGNRILGRVHSPGHVLLRLR